MEIDGAVVVVTGGGSGIGAALIRRFVADGAAHVVAADLDGPAAHAVASSIGAVPAALDVTDPSAVEGLVSRVIADVGRIDLFCANAGIATGGGLDAPLSEWHQVLDVNVMGHLHCARAVVPAMVAHGGGHILFTASAAGLLTAPGDAPYSVSKHAVVGLAEWVAVHYGPSGIGVSVLCPMGVATPLLMDPLASGDPSAAAVAASGEILSVEAVADSVVFSLRANRFLILPHPEVAAFWARKAADPEKWIAAVRSIAGGSAASGPAHP